MTNPALKTSAFLPTELMANFLAAISDVLIDGVDVRQVVIPPFGRTRLGTSAGVILKRGSGAVVIVHGTISSLDSVDAEWRRIQAKARTVGMVVSRLRTLMLFTVQPQHLRVTYEGVALGGSPLTTKNLPMLGLVAGRLIEGLVEEGGTPPDDLREMPISSWKLAFAGHSLADKDMVKERLESILGINFARKDEDNAIDATAMAILESTSSDGFGKATRGRILPQSEKGKTA